MTDSDDRLARLARADARAAGEAIAQLHGPACYALAYRLLGRRDDALDCVQDAFVRILRHLHGWRGEGGVKAWAMRIVANEAFRAMHKRARRSARGALAAPGWEAADPADEASRREDARAVREALAGLPDGQRETVALRHYGGLSIAEIAAHRGCAEGTVKATLFQAYRSLAWRLKNDE